MIITDKHTDRLRTKNFRTVRSEAVKSVDYDESQKIIEIEFTNREIYHYLRATKKEWNNILRLVTQETGLGAYINKQFKSRYLKNSTYYKLT